MNPFIVNVALTLVLVLGISIGSFLNALEWRLHNGKSIFWGRSSCRKCQKTLAWHEIIPLVSYFYLRGSCSGCKEKISWQYPAVELAVGLLFLVAYYKSGALNLTTDTILEFARQGVIVALAVFIFLYDIKYLEVEDRVTLGGAALIFILSIIIGRELISGMIIGALVGACFFLWQYLISRGRWIGGGDIRLGFLLGIALGWPMIITALAMSYILGAVISLALVIGKRKTFADKTPFGTYLACSLLITFWWGKDIVSWYMAILR